MNSRFAPAVADPATCTSSTACSTATALGVPVLAIAAHIPSAEIGTGYFQETHPETLFQECSHYCELISGPHQMPRTLEVAIRQAVGNRGVSVVVIPGDVALQPAPNAPAPKVLGLLPPRPLITPTPRRP